MALLLLAALQNPAVDAWAAEPDDTGRYSLGEIVVSGSAEAGQAGVQASETVYTVSSDEIRSKGARTLDQAIELLPGINVRVGGEGIPRIDVRGFRTRHVLLLLDGIPMNSALDQQFDPTAIPTENIAEIKVTSGSSSVLYGQGGLGAVINIITKKGRQGVQGRVGAETGDHEPYLVKGSVSGASDRFNYFLSGSSTQVDAFPLAEDFRPTSEQGSGYRKNSDRNRNNLLGTVGFTPNEDLSLGFTLNYSQGGYGKPTTAVNDPGDPFAATPKYYRVNDYENISLQLALDYAVTQRLTLRGWAYLNDSADHESQYDNANFDSFNADGSFSRARVETSVKGVTLQPKYSFGAAGTLALALSAEGDSWDNNGAQTAANAGPKSLAAHKNLELYSAGGEYEISPLMGLELVAGYGHYWQNRSQGNSDDYSVLFGASYQVTQDTRLKASFKRNVRFPSLGDLYDLDKGNAFLATERSYTYEAGVEQKLPLATTVSLTGFYTTARNLIQNDQASARNQNLTDVRFAGAEVSAETTLVNNLLLKGSYSHLHSEDRSRGGRDEQRYTPGDQATLETKYDFACGFSPYASVRYVGNQFFYTKNNVTPVLRAKLNDYALVNVKLSQRLWDGKATLYVGADNLFDVNYETSYGFPQAGRFIYGGVEFRL